MIYRCYLLDATDCIREREHFHAEHDAEATERAREFLFETGHVAAELWVSSRLVARLNKEGKPV